MGCISGGAAKAVEMHNWEPFFVKKALTVEKLTVFGYKGYQVRDVIHARDLAKLFLEYINDPRGGEVYNIGGGAENVMSIWTEFGPMLEKLLGEEIPVARSDWRPGDQKVFYADIRKAVRELGWKPKIGVEQGVEMLFSWVRDNKNLF